MSYRDVMRQLREQEREEKRQERKKLPPPAARSGIGEGAPGPDPGSHQAGEAAVNRTARSLAIDHVATTLAARPNGVSVAEVRAQTRAMGHDLTRKDVVARLYRLRVGGRLVGRQLRAKCGGRVSVRNFLTDEQADACPDVVPGHKASA